MISGARLARGGVYLVGRQVVGTAISLLAMFFVTGTIGAAAFGSFAAAAAIVTVVQTVSLMGIPVFLLRRPQAPERADYDTAFTLTLLLAAGVTVVGTAASTFLQKVTGLPDVPLVAASMFLATPVLFAGAIPTAALERSLDFRRIAAIEFVSQLGNVAVSIPLALTGAGVWSPVAGWWAGICVTALLSLVFGPYRPRFRWNTALAGQMLAFGFRFSASSWLLQLRQLFNPLLVGPFLGAEAVGVFALTTRIVEALTFVKAIAWRMSLAAFAQIGGGAERIAVAVAKGARLQMLVMLPLLIGFSLVGPQLVTLVLGRDWSVTRTLFPPIAMGVIVNCLFSLQASALHVGGRSPTVALYSAVHVALLMIGGWFALPVLGIDGIAVAELAALAAYPILHLAMVDAYGPSRMHLAYLLGISGAIALFWHTAGALAWIPLIGVILSRPFRRVLREELPALLKRPREAASSVLPILTEMTDPG